MKRFGCIAVVILLAAACGLGGKYRTEIEANKVTVQSIEEFITALENCDAGDVNESRSSRLERLQSLEAALKAKGDTLSARDAQMLAKLSAEGEPYHPFSVETETALSKLRRSHAQLKALNHDLENNLLPADSVRYLVHHERRFAEKALAKAEELLNTTADEAATRVDWYQKIDSLEQDLISLQK